ncbi:MAG TPA: hypothetical protein VEX17_03375 [Bacillales bacterium]|nr:hypothetical protein [Bacillales bacterium]
MGRIKCKTHGITGMVLACDHLRQDILDKIKFKKVITVVFSDEELGKTFVLRYCPDCAVEHDFPIEDTEMPDENFNSMYEKNFSPNCYKCFQELIN